MKKLVFYGSWLVFPLMFWVGWRFGLSFFGVGGVAIGLLFVYMRFVEPWWIKVVSVDVGLGFKVAVVSDLHLGVYKGKRFLDKIVDIVNEQKPDLVFFPGDFVYGAKDLKGLMAGLKRINGRKFGVMGNHDVKPKGEFDKDLMKIVLENNGLKMADNKVLSFDFGQRRVVVTGVGSMLSGHDRYAHLVRVREFGDLILGMVHNPDALMKGYFSGCDVVVCGHTHGGQIRIPFLYKLFIPCKNKFDKGLTTVDGTKVFISSGVGETLLPMRLGVRPEVVVLR